MEMAKYEILPERCVQTANCVEVAPSLFGFDDDEVVSTLKEGPESEAEQEALKNAVRGCPALAIVYDE
jgi:ferredoxin